MTEKFNIPIARTSLLESEIQSALEPLNSGWLVQGPKVQEFEDAWSEFTLSANSVAVTSCTTALHLSLAALGFGPDDEAIVPAFTWISTANVVEHLGGRVVFCDIDPLTFNIDVNKIEEKITSKTKAILPVHLFGLAANMDAINKIAKDNNLWVIEDAACGFGAKYKGSHVGTLGDTGCFSFHPRKAITTGEGGMVTTSNDDLADKIRCLRDHGATMSDLQRHLGAKPYLLADHPEAGYNQRMTDIQAAIGVAQMNRAEEIIAERRQLAKKYDSEFQNIEWLRIPQYSSDYEHGYQSYPCMFKPNEVCIDNVKKLNNERNIWMEFLQYKGISTRPATHAVHMLSYYKNKYQIKDEDFPNAYMANECSISLPLFHGMKKEEQMYIIKTVLTSDI